MSNYKIKERQFQNAKKIGVEIKSSTSKNKKIDVFLKNKKVGSIGGVKSDGQFYMDYASYIIKIGKEKANKKRTNYLRRHAKEAKIKDGKRTNSYYADIILWS